MFKRTGSKSLVNGNLKSVFAEMAAILKRRYREDSNIVLRKISKADVCLAAANESTNKFSIAQWWL